MRCNILINLHFQTQLIGEKLFSWKNAQKLAQIGMPFDNREQLLDEIQIEFEFLADQNWQLNMFSCWMLDLLRRAPQLNDGLAQATIGKLTAITEQLNKLLFMLVSQSFIVSVQPEPVLKTQHKFVTEVCFLMEIIHVKFWWVPPRKPHRRDETQLS